MISIFRWRTTHTHRALPDTRVCIPFPALLWRASRVSRCTCLDASDNLMDTPGQCQAHLLCRTPAFLVPLLLTRPNASPMPLRVHALNPERLNTGHLTRGVTNPERVCVPTQRGKAIPGNPQDWERGYPRCYWLCGQSPNCTWKTGRKLVYLVNNMQTA